MATRFPFKQDGDYLYNVATQQAQSAIKSAKAGKCAAAIGLLAEAAENDGRGTGRAESSAGPVIYSAASQRSPAMVREAQKAIAQSCFKKTEKTKAPAKKAAKPKSTTKPKTTSKTKPKAKKATSRR